MSECLNIIYLFVLATLIFKTQCYINNTGTRTNDLKDSELLIKIIKTNQILMKEKVEIKLYYECLCPDCRDFDTRQFVPVVHQLNEYMDIHTYPYGNAKTEEHNGQYKFTCQHGPEECYGNMLHACAISVIKNITESIFFNACMMEDSQNGHGSNDHAADICGKSMDIDPEPIKRCAKGKKGSQLLKYYGEKSKRANFQFVPYILINGKVNDGSNFLQAVCDELKNKPATCPM